MKDISNNRTVLAFSLFELLLVIALILILAALWFSSPHHTAHDRARRIQCVNNLKQDAVAFRIWAGDHGDKYPMQVSTNNGGTMEYVDGPETFRHFQVLSNELSTPKTLYCPSESDSFRMRADTFNLSMVPPSVLFTSNSNLSYFVGLGANPTNATMFLAGDHNLTNTATIKAGVLETTTTWTAEMHKRQGNVAMADGRVQQLNNRSTLVTRWTLGAPGIKTNRLSMP